MSFSVLEKQINYTFINKDLLTQALTHKSKGLPNNERLEFIGDSLLNTIIALELYARFKVDEGLLTRMRSALVCGSMLAKIGSYLHLDKYLILSDSERRTGGHHRSSLLADALEAIFASIFLDSGRDFAVIEKIVLQIFQPYLTEDLLEQGLKDPKTHLQELRQARNLPLPVYIVEGITGKDHNQNFIVSCLLEDCQIKTRGVGGSRRKAEQMAATAAIEELKKNE